MIGKVQATYYVKHSFYGIFNIPVLIIYSNNNTLKFNNVCSFDFAQMFKT